MVRIHTGDKKYSEPKFLKTSAEATFKILARKKYLHIIMVEYLLKPGIECQRTDPVFFHALPDHNAEKTPAFKKPLAHKMLP